MFPFSGSHAHTHTLPPSHSKQQANKVLTVHTLMCFTYIPLNVHFIFKLQASLVICDLTLRVFAITRFREKKPWENCTVILQSPCTVVAWLCGVHQLVTSYQYQCERECWAS